MSKPLSLRPDYPGISGGAAVPRGREAMMDEDDYAFFKHERDRGPVPLDEKNLPVSFDWRDVADVVKKNLTQKPSAIWFESIRPNYAKLTIQVTEDQIPLEEKERIAAKLTSRFGAHQTPKSMLTPFSFRFPSGETLAISIQSGGHPKSHEEQYGSAGRVAQKYLRRFRSTDPNRTPAIRQANMETSVLDGMPKRKVLDLINRLVEPHTRGIFSDQYWAPVQAIRKELERNAIPAEALTGSGLYSKDERGRPASKSWRYQIEFTNNRGNPDKVYLHITASGAGSVEDPLDRYDVVAYAV